MGGADDLLASAVLPKARLEELAAAGPGEERAFDSVALLQESDSQPQGNLYFSI